MLETEPFEAGEYSLRIAEVLDLADKPMTEATFTLNVAPDSEMPQDAEENPGPEEPEPARDEPSPPDDSPDQDPVASETAADSPVRVTAAGQVCSTGGVPPTPNNAPSIVVLLVMGGLLIRRRP